MRENKVQKEQNLSEPSVQTASPPEATHRLLSLCKPESLLTLAGCDCLPLKSPGIADADGVPIIHKTPAVQPSPFRLKQQNNKLGCWIFLETAGVC